MGQQCANSGTLGPIDLAHAVRAVREAAGLTQYDFAEWLLVSRKTVQRWEAGHAVPDARAEQALVDFCRDRGAFAGGDPLPGTLAEIAPDEPRFRAQFAQARAQASGRDRLDAALESVPPPPSGTSARLFGRAELMTALQAHLATRRVVTLTGPGGVGKTTLAAAVAEEHGGRVVTVELAAVGDAAAVPRAVAAAAQARQRPLGTVRESMVDALDGAPTLLVLDNFEHVAAASPVVADLVASCPQLTVLVTSRSPLRLQGEQEVPVGPLAVPEIGDDVPLDDLLTNPAVELFVERARAVQPDFAVTVGSAAALAEVCRELDGLPLAIELAAARVRVIPPAVLHDRLTERLRLLRTTAADVTPRHRALSATLSWSYDLASPAERMTLDRLAVFASPFDLADAEAVVPDADGIVEPDRVVDHLGALVDQSLVQSGPGHRFHLLQTVRAFLIDRPGGPPDESTRQRHARRMSELARQVASRLHGPEQQQATRELAARRADLDLAFEYLQAADDTQQVLRLSVALGGFWDAESALTEGRDRLARALTMPGGPSRLRAAASTWAAYLAAPQLDLGPAARLASDALRVGEELQDDVIRGYALMVLGGVALEQGDDAEGIRHYEASLEALRAAGDTWGSARPLNSLAEAARSAGDLDRAGALHEEALGICRALSDRHSQVMILCGIGHVRRLQGDTAGAIAAGREAVALGAVIDNAVGVATACELLAAVAAATGEVERSARWWGAADADRARSGSAVERRDRAEQLAARAQVRAELGEERWVAYLAAGAAAGAAGLLDLP